MVDCVIPLTLMALLYSLGHVTGQCVTANDIKVNETSVGEAVRTLIDGSLGFSLNMLRVLESQERLDLNSNGLFFSPFSVWSVLMTTYMGSNGRTEQELRNVLGTGNMDKVATWGAYRNIRNWNAYRQVQPQEQSYAMANQIYFQSGTTFRDCMREFIESDISFLDFEKDPEGSRQAINAWVETQTRQRIKDLVPADSIHSLTKMVIANAVYFKESWLQQFDPKNTKRRRFTLSSRKEIPVNMMNMRGRFLYGISEELQCVALELPYTGNDLSMMILLPNNRYHGVSILTNRLTPQALRNLVYEMYPREVLVSLPKFRIEDNFELAAPLSKMGLRTLFDQQYVDLSGFTGQKDLTVDAVHHKSFIDVNEEGTEAAAATAIISSRTARPLGPAAFIADYPFIFLIRDNLSNVILFMGTVQKPPEFGKE